MEKSWKIRKSAKFSKSQNLEFPWNFESKFHETHAFLHFSRIFLWKLSMKTFYENFLWKFPSWFSMKILVETRWKFGIPHFRAPQAHFPWVRLVVVVNFVGVRCVQKSGFEGTSGNYFRCEATENPFVLFCSLEIWSRTFERILGFLWALSRS